jgi:hypothetical protein
MIIVVSGLLFAAQEEVVMSVPPYLLEICCLLEDVLIVAILLNGFRIVLGRTQVPAPLRMRIGLGITAILLAWNWLSFYLAKQGAFLATQGGFRAAHPAGARALKIIGAFPPIVLAVCLPVIVGLWLIIRSKTMAKIVDATPLSWLVGVQFYRVIGAIFLVLWGVGQLPWQFAFPAGGGDSLVGILAIPVAWAASKGSKGSSKAAYAWNVFGILDFVVALGTGFLTSPSPFQMLALDHPNLLVLRYPLVIIPAFLVPLSSILHGTCLWKLRRMERLSD